MGACLSQAEAIQDASVQLPYLELLQSLPIGIVVLGRAGEILLINPSAQKLLSDSTCLPSLPPAIGEIWASCIPGEAKSVVCELKSKHILLTCTKKATANFAGLAILQEASVFDNPRWEMNSIENLNQELEAIFAFSYDELFVTDGEGKTLRASKACERHYGLSPEQLVGRYVQDLEEEEVFKPSATLMAIKTGRRVTVLQETNLGRKLIATANPVYDENTNIIRVVSNTKDVTELIQLGEQLEEALSKVEQYRSELDELKSIQRPSNLVVRSSIMEQVLGLARKVAQVDTTVLLLGETGCGKSAIAHFIHQMSLRSKGPFIDIDCGAIPHSLLESELFGYEEGAFTGAKKQGKGGLIEMAEGGTLFLDEIAEIPLNLQVKLLRVLQDRRLFRVGGTKPISVNIRIVAATNKDLASMVAQGTFREDLYYRLNVVPINIPPLRERKDDIPYLVRYFLKIYNKRYGIKKRVTPEVMNAFCDYQWPGNIRELENILERLIVTSDQETLDFACLPENIRIRNAGTEGQSTNLKYALETVERKLLEEAWLLYRNTYKVAEFLGISQSTAMRKLQKYNLLR